MSPLIRTAVLKADSVRMEVGLNMFQPLNIFDLCAELGLSVRFIDVNMEGLYIKPESGAHPTILISNQRPLARRCFTCAHELGHHVFNHGSRIDALCSEDVESSFYDNDEFLVDVFAGALLMPLAGIQAEFAKRGWDINTGSPIQFYTVSSVFGTGYQTLITHCKKNKLIYETHANNLLKLTPSKIFKTIFQPDVSNLPFKIIDEHSLMPLTDIEVSSYIILPSGFKVEGNHILEVQNTSLGMAYLASKPGIVRAVSSNGQEGLFIRIQSKEYIGLAENRHLTND